MWKVLWFKISKFEAVTATTTVQVWGHSFSDLPKCCLFCSERWFSCLCVCFTAVCVCVCLHERCLAAHTKYPAVCSVVTGQQTKSRITQRKWFRQTDKTKHQKAAVQKKTVYMLWLYCITDYCYFVHPLGIVTVIDAKYGLQVGAKMTFKKLHVCHPDWIIRKLNDNIFGSWLNIGDIFSPVKITFHHAVVEEVSFTWIKVLALNGKNTLLQVKGKSQRIISREKSPRDCFTHTYCIITFALLLKHYLHYGLICCSNSKSNSQHPKCHFHSVCFILISSTKIQTHENHMTSTKEYLNFLDKCSEDKSAIYNYLWTLVEYK